jgi:hypothetical protein
MASLVGSTVLEEDVGSTVLEEDVGSTVLEEDVGSTFLGEDLHQHFGLFINCLGCPECDTLNPKGAYHHYGLYELVEKCESKNCVTVREELKESEIAWECQNRDKGGEICGRLAYIFYDNKCAACCGLTK